ncbi:MAG: DUF3617 family protein [Gammaproteobacteria bacterium]
MARNWILCLMSACMLQVLQDTTVSWNITCKNGARGSGSAVYHGDTMQGSSVMTMPGAPMKLRSTIDGKWIAAKCDVR